jgi:hypothetical protein
MDEPSVPRGGGEMHEADPTGFSALPPPGPAMPVMATARSTGAWASAPRAIASAVFRLTAPWRSRIAAGTPSIACLAASITDTDGKFHHLSNVYVAGPALFPTLGSANPTLTGLSLARRTGDAILKARRIKPPTPRGAPGRRKR